MFWALFFLLYFLNFHTYQQKFPSTSDSPDSFNLQLVEVSLILVKPWQNGNSIISTRYIKVYAPKLNFKPNEKHGFNVDKPWFSLLTISTGWIPDVSRTTQQKVDTRHLTNHWPQGGYQMSYWPSAQDGCQTSYRPSAQDGCQMSYRPLTTGWILDVLLTTQHRVDTDILLTTQRRVNTRRLTVQSAQGGSETSYFPALREDGYVLSCWPLITGLDKRCFTDCTTNVWKIPYFNHQAENWVHWDVWRVNFLKLEGLILFHFWSVKRRAINHCVKLSYMIFASIFPAKSKNTFNDTTWWLSKITKARLWFWVGKFSQSAILLLQVCFH